MISFCDIRAYLDAIAQKNGLLANSPHGAFWRTDYRSFTTGQVPNVGDPIPILDPNHPLQSPFFRILVDPAGFGGLPQMPAGGPFITDAGYQVTLADGTQLTGQQIQDNISSWLQNGFPP